MMNGRRFLSLLVCSTIIVLLLAAVVFPQYLTSRERAKIAELKWNMYTIQLAIDTKTGFYRTTRERSWS
jgi:type II secretory pathway pseudopilin PulG